MRQKYQSWRTLGTLWIMHLLYIILRMPSSHPCLAPHEDQVPPLPLSLLFPSPPLPALPALPPLPPLPPLPLSITNYCLVRLTLVHSVGTGNTALYRIFKTLVQWSIHARLAQQRLVRKWQMSRRGWRRWRRVEESGGD